MKLVHAMPLSLRLVDVRTSQALVAFLFFACVLTALDVVVRARPAIEGMLATMNASFLSLVAGAMP